MVVRWAGETHGWSVTRCRGGGAAVVVLAAAAVASAACTGNLGEGGTAGGQASGGADGAGGQNVAGAGGEGGWGAAAAGGGKAGGAASGGGAVGGAGGSGYDPICLASQAGAYCGDDAMQNADPDVLYQCPGANQPPTSSTPCPDGCVVESQGTADHCQTPLSPDGYRLPWKPGVTMQLTQDCNDSCCNDHVGDDGWAWDFANGSSFTVRAARGGTVTHLKVNSTNGCGSSSCVNDANFIVIDHGDGTQSTYLHLQGMSLKPGVQCGAAVTRGQDLAQAGTTGWSTGIHLHFQVSQVHSGAPSCECGSGGMGCSASSVPWSSFWSTPTYPTLAITFDEWPATSACADRRIPMPASQNQ